MKKIVYLVFVLLLFCMDCPLSASAVSYPVIQEQREERAAKGIKVVGNMLCLFQSGTAEVKKEIHTNDILAVYREDPNHQVKEVGKIKILSYVGEDYLKGEVVEGEIMPGDIAKKGEVASLVISTDDRCKEEKTLQPAAKMRK